METCLEETDVHEAAKWLRLWISTALAAGASLHIALPCIAWRTVGQVLVCGQLTMTYHCHAYGHMKNGSIGLH